MAKKLIALLLAVLMVAGMLAGCAKTAETPAPAAEDPADTSDSSSTTDTPAPSSDAEPIEISIAYEESTHPVDTDTFAACKKLEEIVKLDEKYYKIAVNDGEISKEFMEYYDQGDWKLY